LGDTPAVNQPNAQPEADAQPLALKDFMKALISVRRRSSLYGSDHPSTLHAVEEFTNILKGFLDCFGPSTFVLTEDAVVLNDRWFEASGDSRELFHRLRSRGAMAFSLVGEPSSDQLVEFLLYLSAEPREIRDQGGSNIYLRKHGVTRIVVTEALLVSEQDDGPVADKLPSDKPAMNRAVAAVITWLTRQDEEEESPRLRISEIFADPDAAAKLIRQVIMKLRSTHAKKKPSELAADVVNELKDLAAGNKEEWDKAVPGVRKAMAKLPPEMRPTLGKFGSHDQDVEMGATGRVSVTEVESTVNKFLMTESLSGDMDMESLLTEMEQLFGGYSSGLLSNWKNELLPANTIRSSVGTLSMLMGLETNSLVHGQIARSLAALITRALEANEPHLAMESASILASEARLSDQPLWRNMNVKSALKTVDMYTLRNLVERALQTGSVEDQEAAAGLVEAVPSLALSVAESLGVNWSGHFLESLRAGLAQIGQTAGPVLGRLLTNGEGKARRAALKMLADLQTDWSLLEIETALKGADESFVVMALELASKVRSPIVLRMCAYQLRHKHADVRLTAIRVIGDLGDESDAVNLMKFASMRAIRQNQRDEQLQALRVLGRIGGADMIGCLESAAVRRPLFWRSRYEPVREAAGWAVNEIRARLSAAAEQVA